MSIIQDTLKTKKLEDLVKEKSSSEKTYPELTAKVVNDTIKMLKDIDSYNGYNHIAKQIGWDKIRWEQVKEIHQNMMEKVSELQTAKLNDKK